MALPKEEYFILTLQKEGKPKKGEFPRTISSVSTYKSLLNKIKDEFKMQSKTNLDIYYLDNEGEQIYLEEDSDLSIMLELNRINKINFICLFVEVNQNEDEISINESNAQEDQMQEQFQKFFNEQLQEFKKSFQEKFYEKIKKNN